MISFSRHWRLENETRDGNRLKTGVLFRSDQLSRITDLDREWIQA
ncbi:hypothetical protein EDM52_23685 [Brevibacillus invocatus]|uniref:Uncharacterized protein n=1 Tax=Brevibacillus invocatus TaxID=173959 RepID=A0A3M8BR79_9BACL|nr:hypothetical protein EDM52_23685 [Brevibacillus invocatus]